MAANRETVPTLASSDVKELKEKLITACHILDHEGVTDGYGHISVRVPGADARIRLPRRPQVPQPIVAAQLQRLRQWACNRRPPPPR